MQALGTDSELLRRYAWNGDAVAFGELVRRHAGLVYAAAYRQTGRADSAEDVTQAVFILLARRAERLGENIVLAAWLYKATRYTALNAKKTENRRRIHERRAAAMAKDSRREQPVYDRIAPELDEGIAALPTKDRQAIILRFLQQKSLYEVGNVLGISESAAQMRVARALERLRAFFRRRGVDLSATALGGVVIAHVAPPVPAHLARLVAERAILPAEHLPVAASKLADAAAQTMTRQALRSAALIASAAAVLLIIVLAIGHRVMRPLPDGQHAGPESGLALSHSVDSNNHRVTRPEIASILGI
jgi:RNA polymerase sigma factor (sigma-70 family)